MSKRHLLALFDSFDEAGEAILELRGAKLKGFDTDHDMIIKSPIEHPEFDRVFGPKPVHVQWFPLFGSIIGCTFLFILVSGAQANFFEQLKGGKPIVPIPINLVMTYALFMLSGVFFTVLGLFVCAGLPARRLPLYSSKVLDDQIGILVKADEATMPAIKAILTKHKAIEFQEEAGK